MLSALVFYHYFYPDDVITAIHLSELCEERVRPGWEVTARPSNRSCRSETERYASRERWKGVSIRRIWRALPSSGVHFGADGERGMDDCALEFGHAA